MSLINRMLQDLDRRQALQSANDSGVASVRTVATGQDSRREWLWRVLAVLMLVALAWACWVAYELWPRSIATDLALRQNLKAMSAIDAAAPVARSAELVASDRPPMVAPAPEGADMLRMSFEIRTPIRSGENVAAPLAGVKPLAGSAGRNEPATPVQSVPAVAPSSDASHARALESTVKPSPRPAVGNAGREAGASPGKGTVDKRDRAPASPGERAEQHFRQAVALLNQGRSAEGEQQLAAALDADPSHHAARQAQVALLIEHGRIDAARRALQEALAVDPAHPYFAATLARIFAERREYDSALQVLGRMAPENAADAEVLALKAGILQRMTRHAEAAEAYEQSLRRVPGQANAWVGYGISLDALGRRSEALLAYRRALSEGRLAPEIRDYAEKRLRTD